MHLGGIWLSAGGIECGTLMKALGVGSKLPSQNIPEG